MEWTDIRLTVSKADAEAAEAVATMIAEGGIYIEDYSDIEEQVEQIAHVDLIEQELLDKPRDTVIIHMYLEPGASPVETLALIAARMEAAGIPYTSETEGVEQEDWQNGWRKYYHPMDVGQRLAIVPSWQDYDTDRVKLILDRGRSGRPRVGPSSQPTIVANAIMSLAPAVPGLMADDAVFIASGIIDSRKDEVIAALEAAGLAVLEVKEKRGWECIVCKKA